MLEPEYVMQLNNVLHRAGKHLNMSASYDYGAPKHPTAPYDTPRSTFGVTAFYTPPLLFIPRHTIVAGYYGFTLDVRVSVRPSVSRTSIRPSVFRFRMITIVAGYYGFTLDVRVSVRPSASRTSVRPFFVSG